MPIPNKTGGAVQIERKTSTPYNSDGTSKALFANQPNEADWEHEGEVTDEGEPARQCAAAQQEVVCTKCGTEFSLRGPGVDKTCPNCDSDEYFRQRCKEIAVDGYMTCKGHGGGFTQKPEVLEKARLASQKHGLSVKEFMQCPCMAHGDHCEFKGQYLDDMGWKRCYPEKMLYDSITAYFQQSYELDDAADLLMLNRLGMTLVRISRNEKLIAKYGEMTERSRTGGDGSVETWWEESAASKIADKLDKRLQSWLKELAVTKAARDGRKVTVSGSVDIATMLCNIPTENAEVVEI